MSENKKPNLVIKTNFSLLALALILLKVTDTISWSWWLVLMPLWIGPAILLGITLFAFVMIMIAAILRALE